MPQIISAKNAQPSYFKDYISLMRAFDPKALARFEYADGFYPYPSIHSAHEIKELEHIQLVLQKALKQVVTNYFEDNEIQSIVTIPRAVAKQLKRLTPTDYNIGLIRPDYIYTQIGKVQICEINARFGFNAAYMSTYAHGAMRKEHAGYKAISGTTQLQADLRTLNKSNVAVVKEREEGYDIHFLLLTSQKAHLESTKYLDNLSHVKDDLLVLELHQDELTHHLSKICDYILTGGEVLNDPRTIYIAHDKRLLAVLCDTHIMNKYLSSDEAQLLKRHIVPSFTQDTSQTKFVQAAQDKSSWMLKRAISGKGDGLIFGYKTAKKRWEQLLKNKNYVLQPFVVQKTFAFYDPHFELVRNFCIAGTMPMWNDHVYGPGLSRIYSQKPHKFFRFIQPVAKK